ncbi:MAG: glycosyltransferase [Bacteroidetes bacterium]|nr:glycosyltransferase [Bacteroidota bacterium]
MIYFVFAVILIYLAYVISWIWGWKNTCVTQIAELNLKVSLIIPCRNEEQNISTLLKSIDKQNYNFLNLEVIIINDHSVDKTLETIANAKLENFKPLILNLNTNEKGKKAAITKGISNSANEIIVCTDSDCVLGENFLKTIISAFADENIKLVCGPVIFNQSKGIINKYLKLDLISMITIGAATIKTGTPTMCNGANIAYRKSVFNDVKGFEGNENKMSGDDEFLLQKVFIKYSKGIKFVKNKDAIVKTNAPKSLNEFLNQRIRWASKAGHYKAFSSKILPFFIFILNCLMLYTMINFTFFSDLKNFLILWGSKIVIDTCFLGFTLGFFNARKLMVIAIPAMFLHVFYIFFIGILSLSRKYEWKGRTVNS